MTEAAFNPAGAARAAQLRPDLADVALIDAKACAAAASISLTSWHQAVRCGKAPQPVIRAPRCTRWRLIDVREWLVALASRGLDQDVSNGVIATAAKASVAARNKRLASRAEG